MLLVVLCWADGRAFPARLHGPSPEAFLSAQHAVVDALVVQALEEHPGIGYRGQVANSVVVRVVSLCDSLTCW